MIFASWLHASCVQMFDSIRLIDRNLGEFNLIEFVAHSRLRFLVAKGNESWNNFDNFFSEKFSEKQTTLIVCEAASNLSSLTSIHIPPQIDMYILWISIFSTFE